MNVGLKQVLDVYRSVRQEYLPRMAAVRKVGNANRVADNTVMSSCTRGLNITTHEFDYYLEPENTVEFREFLIRKFPKFQDDIVSFFSAFIETTDDTERDSLKKTIRTIFPEEKKQLANELMIGIFKQKFQEWTARSDIPADVTEQLKDWLQSMHME